MNERARSWGLRLLALGLAIGIWFNASVEDRLELSERLVEASVSYNRPRGFIIMNQLQSVNVRLMGDVAIIHARTSYVRPDGGAGAGRYTDVWARRQGRWLAVSAHVTRC